MTTDPYAGYVNQPLDIVKKAMVHIFPQHTIEYYVDGTNVSGATKPKRLRVFYNKTTKLVSRVVAG